MMAVNYFAITCPKCKGSTKMVTSRKATIVGTFFTYGTCSACKGLGAVLVEQSKIAMLTKETNE